MKLFCDDLRQPYDNTWVVARTNTEAIRLLRTLHVVECSIDHDIVVPNFDLISDVVKKRLKIGEETFAPVVYYIIAMKPEDRPKKVIMHTANTSVGLQMLSLLKEAGIDSEYKQGSYNIDIGDDVL